MSVEQREREKSKASTTNSKEWLTKDATYLAPAYARCFDLVAERAEGTYIYDLEGNRFIDFTMGIGVNNVGHCHPEVVKATTEQIGKLIHCSSVTRHTMNIRLAEKIADIAPGRLDCVFLNNSGGEAVDAAVKMARYVTGRPNIVSFTGAFHGRTLLATALTTAKAHYREGYDPLPSGIYQIPYPYCLRCPVNQVPGKCELECFELVERLFDYQVKPQTVAAIIMEPVLGEGGYVVPATGYTKQNGFMKRLRQLCDEHGILLIFDEVQSGFGRTGKWFACQHWDVEPDVMIVAKGIASGFPMAGIISRKELMDKWTVGRHGSTYGGNPVACAAALASIKVIEEGKLLDNATRMGEYLQARLGELAKRYPFIGEVRGLGLMIGVEVVDEKGKADGARLSRLVDACFQRRLLLLDCGSKDHIIRFIPPLNVTKEQIDDALQVFEQALESVK
ncbi:MAG TPA: aspartate aminotransferase family protein [Candidatus Obscuribacterales bacterium]